MKGPFRSLASVNYRWWAGGSLISNIGTWFQRIAQDWLVLTQLTHHSAVMVGVVMALQAAPSLLLLPLTGYAADHLNRRRLLIATQAAQAVLAFAMGALTLSHRVALWHVLVIAAVFGCVTAFDAPVRQTFVAELVGDEELSNAVALNATIFNLARMIGPALAGVLIAAFGTGWAFLANGASFAAVLESLLVIRPIATGDVPVPTVSRGRFVAGFDYAWQRPDLRAVLAMTFLVGTFGLNFPIFVSAMAVTVFRAGAGDYGMLMAVMAVGSIVGALHAANRASPTVVALIAAASIFALGLVFAAVSPDVRSFALALTLVGGASVAFTTSTGSFLQLASDRDMRGRVASFRLALGLGGTPIGAPIMGWASDRFGPPVALALGALSGFAAAAIGLRYLVRYRDLRIERRLGSVRTAVEPSDPAALLAHHGLPRGGP